MPFNGISVRRLLPAPRERVFEAWTRPELMARWFFPDDGWTAAITSDLKVGGSYEIAMRDAAGGQHLQFGHYREIVPVSRLVFTWNCPELDVTDSVVTVVLIDQGDRTELVLTHELPPDPKIRRGHEEGWEGCLSNLDTMFSDRKGKEAEMSSIKDDVRIHAAASEVYEALTRQTAYRGWWNAAGDVAETVGGEARLRFVKDGNQVNMRFRIDDMTPNESVRWTCVAHDMRNWVGTTLTWRITEAGGAVLVALDHDGWTGEAPASVAQGWKHFLGSLKSYVETGTGQPW